MNEIIDGVVKLASKLRKPWHIITVIILVLLFSLAAVFFAKGHRINSHDISQHIENINSPTNNTTTNTTINHLPPLSGADILPSKKKIASIQNPKIFAESSKGTGKKTKASEGSDNEELHDKSFAATFKAVVHVTANDAGVVSITGGKGIVKLVQYCPAERARGCDNNITIKREGSSFALNKEGLTNHQTVFNFINSSEKWLRIPHEEVTCGANVTCEKDKSYFTYTGIP